MSGLWKYLVLLAELAGIAGFLLPFVDVHTHDARYAPSPPRYGRCSNACGAAGALAGLGALIAPDRG